MTTMTTTPPGMPQACPYLFYDDLPAAIRFLCDAFGFRERFVSKGRDGAVEHAQLQLGSAVVMLGPTHTEGALRLCRNPREAGSLNAGVYLFIDDVDEGARRAKAAGANVLMAPQDMPWGDRLFCAEDPEGHFWMFAKFLGLQKYT